MTPFALFGGPDGRGPYRARSAAYGVLPDTQGRILVVAIDEGDRLVHDLPGGGVDPGETAEQALRREFAEETGLVLDEARRLANADHYWVKPKTGERVFNRAAYYAVSRSGEDGVKIEADHTPVWLDPLEAQTRMRHDAAAWAIAMWMRAGAFCGA